ncbi:D-sedoheptulose-7-phosphate isomerase [Pectinatus frisingensis]|uniref:D-sedoheptulose-7-phosphate isomerase n=1 Tax=Pectinatus frisingensis TaxID=865 RepID=UPI003D80027E
MDKILNEYIKNLTALVAFINQNTLLKFIDLLEVTRQQHKTIFVCGNGGSTATVNHFVCDLGKNAISTNDTRFKIISLCDNIETITAFGNDLGFENIFVERLHNLISPGDLLMALSASGNSPNILKAAHYAHSNNCNVLSMTGYDGGKLKTLSDCNINIDSNIIEQIEDLHLIIEHMIVYHYKRHIKTNL